MIGSLMMCVSVVLLLLGIVTGNREDFVPQPAHAHLNLVGGVLLFLFGLYCRLIPTAPTVAWRKAQGAPYHRWHPDAGGRCGRGHPWHRLHRHTDRGIADYARGHGAFCCDCVPHRASLKRLVVTFLGLSVA